MTASALGGTASTSSAPPESAIFRAITINGVRFKNRVLRASVGGRASTYSGSVTDVWKNFEKRFADGGVGGIVSTTFHVDKNRVSPLEYPSIAEARHVPHLREHIAGIRRDQTDCRYIVQLGDPGYCTYTSLFPEDADGLSSSSGFDFAFGYGNRRSAMSPGDIARAIGNFADAAARVRDAGADGIEVTATKGYLIHQFLNPGINRRRDEWGGSVDNRFRLLDAVVQAIRGRVGRDFLFGIRLSSADFNYSPFQLSLFRTPSILGSRERWMGNDEARMLDYAKRLRALEVDFLHVVAGYGFPNPRDTPGEFPFDEIKLFFNTTRHLSRKAALRATVLNAIPSGLGRAVMNIGWKRHPGIHLEAARRFRSEVGLPVIVNGGFQERPLIESALGPGGCDMVSLARALIANPNLLADFRAGRDAPDRPCSFCNKCVGRTPTSPLGCYDTRRFDGSHRAMQDQIMDWNTPDPVQR